MSCSNCPPEACYNGCVQVVSDQCVTYTGLNSIPLDITSGDNLQLVIENIIDKLVPLLSGTGDKITIASVIRCAIVNGYLPTPVGTNQWTSEQLFQTLVKVVCDLQTQITAIAADITTLNADYTIGCLTGVTSSSDTHAIVQAIINKLCTTVADLAALELDVDTNYVKLADLDALIAAYIASQGSGNSNQQYLKMVPYVAYEYYGLLTNFDGSGIGIPANGFFKVYLCNGLNGTPDKRGRVAVGAINNVPGAPLDAAVNPANAGNPNYSLYTTAGSNTVTLTTPQIPIHTHSTTVVASGTVGDHTHVIMGGTGPGSPNVTPTALQVIANYNNDGGNLSYATKPANSQVHNSGITSASGAGPVSLSVGVDIGPTGSGGAHQNIQPVIGAYYIMYIP
jgi:microcystin-dependent protein